MLAVKTKRVIAGWCSTRHPPLHVLLLVFGVQAAAGRATGSPGAAPAPAPAGAQPACNRTLTVVNACNFTVWPLTYGAPMLGNGSFMLRSGESATFIAPPAWLGTWGARTGCQVDNGSVGACETGQCGPNFRCYNGNIAPYTQVKMLFNSFGGQDFYDVIPDVYNIAVLVEPSDPACRAGGCTADLLQHCPETPATARVLDSAGKLIACNSACEAYRDLAHCRFSSAYQRAVKALCPSSATFANDDTQLLGCSGSPDYAITFCGLSTRAQ